MMFLSAILGFIGVVQAPSLISDQWSSLEGDLRLRPDDFGLVGYLWDGKLVAEHLGRRYRVEPGVRQCQRLFRQMGFRVRKPRPKLALADPLGVEVFNRNFMGGQV